MEQEKRDDIPELTYKQFEKLYNSGKDITFGFIRFIPDRLKIREDTIKLLQAEIKDLYAQLTKDSHNSSKPSSSDGFKNGKKQTKSLRKKSKKNQAGKKDMKGKHLKQRIVMIKQKYIRSINIKIVEDH